MELQIPESLFESLQIIIKYQNTLLLKEISKEKGWKLSDLKKEFLKEEDIQNLLKKYSKKKNKVKKKVTPKKKSQTVSEEAQEAPVEETPVKEAAVEETKEVVDGATENIKVEIEEKTVKKKKLKKVVNEKEIRCHKYTFEGAVFYVNVENENAYDKNMEFVGRKLGNGINFDADELEN